MFIDFFKTRVSLSVLSVLLSGAVSSSWAMFEDDSIVSSSSRALVSHAARSTTFGIVTPKTKRTYQPTQERGVPESYSTRVSKEEWTEAVSEISTCLRSGITGYGDDMVAVMLSDWKKTSDNFYSQYQQLVNVPQMIKKLYFGKFKENLFSFVVHFENFYVLLKDSYLAQKKPLGHLNDSFKTFQKTWNGSMKIYQDLTGETLGFFGSLNIAQSHETYYKHLYYTRDDTGFLLFSIYAQEEAMLGSGLYQTYIPYGNLDASLFHQRWVHFRTSPNSSTIELIKNRALIINRGAEKVMSIEPYFGESGVVPFSKGYGFASFADAFLENKTYREQVVLSQEASAKLMNEILGFEGAIPDVMPDELSQNPSVSKSFHIFADRVLGAESKKVVFMPESDVDHMESNYWFLLDLQSRQATTPEDLDVLYALEWFNSSFPEQTLEEVISEYEKGLEDAYAKEEKERLINQIQKEQSERSQMVIEGKHDKQKKKKGKGKKPKKQSISALSSKKNSILSSDQAEENSKAYARKKIGELKGLAKMKDLKKQTKAIGKIIKFTDYVGMVNVAIQELRTLGANVTGGLNESSHGSLNIDDEVMPLHRPHGAKHNMVYGSSARSMLSELLNMYFETAAQKALTEK